MNSSIISIAVVFLIFVFLVPQEVFSVCPVGKWTWGGKIQINFGNKVEQCLPCPSGYKCPNEGMKIPTECEPGTYSPDKGASVCLECQPGNFASANASKTCTQCWDGNVCPVHSMSEPQLCAKGSATLQDPVSLEHFSFLKEIGSTVCVKCAAGTYADKEGQMYCSTCPEDHMCCSTTESPTPCESGTTCTCNQ